MSARVTLEPRRMWSVRASLAFGRWLLYALALSGIAVSVRDLVRPRAQVVRAQAPAPVASLEAQWLALRFARAYMTFTADPAVRERALAPFIAPGGDPDVGATPAVGQRVAWAAVAAERDLGAQRDYTVALATQTGAVRYLVVALTPAPGGGEMLAHYPALVAAPLPVRRRNARRGGACGAPRRPAGDRYRPRASQLPRGVHGEPRGRPRHRRPHRPGGAGPRNPGSAAARRPGPGSRARDRARGRSGGRPPDACLPRRRAPGRRPVGPHEHPAMNTNQGGPR